LFVLGSPFASKNHFGGFKTLYLLGNDKYFLFYVPKNHKKRDIKFNNKTMSLLI
jgi:hypothetical protein